LLTDASAAAPAAHQASGLLEAFVGEQFLPGLALALAIGMLVGIERGWQERDERPGARVAGLRTFSLLGLLGGLAGEAIGGPLSPLLLLLCAGAAGTMMVGYFVDMNREGNVSATSTVAAMLTLALGALAGMGQMAIASVGAGAAVLLLAFREQLHRALAKTSEADFRALIRLVLVVFVILPLLPGTPLGPYGLNPRRLWTVVVVVGSVSFLGYVLVRLVGGRKGAMLTAMVGSLVSSTAVTLDCARRMRAGESLGANQAAIAIGSAIMMLRSLVLVGILVPDILRPVLTLIVPALALAALAAVVLIYRASPDDTALTPGTIRPPDLKLALLFGGLVLLMATAAGWAEQHARGTGAAVVAVGGLFDVDSAIASIGTLPPGTLSTQLAAFAIAAPIVFNSVLKAGMAFGIAGRRAWPAASALLVPALLIGVLIAAAAL